MVGVCVLIMYKSLSGIKDGKVLAVFKVRGGGLVISIYI